MFDDNNRVCGLVTLVIYMQTRPGVYQGGWAAIGHKFKKGGFVSMSRKISFAALVTGTVLLCLPAFSQDEGSRSDVSAQFFGTFVKNTNQNGVRQSSSDSGGVLASYRFFFSKHHGVEANYGYSRSTTSYDFLLGSSGVTANQHEWSGAYIFRVPMRRVTPFIEAGVGGLTFAPRNFAGASSQTRAAFVYGGGADFNLTHRFFVRAQYRGLVYNTPTLNVAANLGADRVTHLAEPSAGFGFRF
jgi:outer membrane immunogenic protein